MKRNLFLLQSLILFCNLLLAQEPKLILPIGHTSFVSFAQFSPDGKKIITASDDHTAKIWDAISGILLVDLKGHTGWVHTVQFSPDGKKVLTAALDNTPKIWDVTTGNLLVDLKGHTNWIEDVQFSPDGKKIVTAADDSTIKIWEVINGNLLTNIRWNTLAINTTQFSPDGKKIVTTGDSTAKIWEVVTGNLLADLKGHTSSVWSANFSSDGKKIVTASYDGTAKIWNAVSGDLLANLKGHNSNVWSANFSPDGKKIVTASFDSTIKIWDVATGNLLVDLKGHTSSVSRAQFSPDGKKIVTASDDNTAKIWDVATANLLANLNGHTSRVWSAQFSPDGKKIATASWDGTAKIWDAVIGKLLIDLKGHTSYFNSIRFSPDGKKIVTASDDHTAKIWDVFTGTLVVNLNRHNSAVNFAQFSPDGKKIVTTSNDSTAKIWDIVSGKLLINLKGFDSRVSFSQYSRDGKKILTTSGDGTAKIWDAETGALLVVLKGHSSWISSAQFSPDGKKIVTASNDSTAKIWDIVSGKLLANLKGFVSEVSSALFSPDGKKIVTTYLNDSIFKLWDVSTGNLLADFKGHSRLVFSGVFSAQFSSNGEKIVTAALDNTAKVWDINSGKILADLRGHSSWVHSAQFTSDDKKIVTASEDGTAKIWDASTGTLLATLKGHTSGIRSLLISPDGKKILTASYDGTAKLWDAESVKLLYTFFAVDSSDYLVVDNDYHYDGTEAARKLIYFTCGSEIIGLDQVKDQLWVPNLAERIMNGETINAAKLSDLNICNLTPLVDTLEQSALQYRFHIKPRLGGLGATIVYVNGIEVKRYTPQQLLQLKGEYYLSIDKKELQRFFAGNKENLINVKSLTAKSSISSRSVSISEKANENISVPPNLYAVIVGVSDYKGEELDLKYAAKDAADIANALDNSAKKLLNTDGKEHVFVYKIFTGAGRDKFPEKNSIHQVFTEIGIKAQPNDILLVFFAGHGVMESLPAGQAGEKNQFYFLTADASGATVSGALKDVGISTEELTDWIKPQSIKAQKRILIFDACNSGQVIKELVSIGKNGQNLLASRGDDKSKQIKAIEKLNERSGMFILSASASNQKAYEIGKYNQGALTYSLLKAIKEEPDILEDKKYLNISRWFNAAEKSVEELSRETGTRQQPQIVSTSNFNIGVVDDDVRNKIVLPFEKFLFTRSEFRNTDLRVDNLKLRNLVDKELNNLSEGNVDAPLLFNPEYEGANVYSLSCDYTVTGNEVNVFVILIKGGTDIKTKFDVKGMADQLPELTNSIITITKDWLKKNN